MKKKTINNKLEIGPTLFDRKFEKPDFVSLLRQPMLKTPLPGNFDVAEEAAHLSELWDEIKQLGNYKYEQFVHAGGSGMVFKVLDDKGVAWALKTVRKKIYHLENKSGEVATTLSPVSEAELNALQKLSHPNVVRLREAIENERGVIAICTTYIDNPQNLDLYLKTILAKHPDPTGKRGIHPFSPQRLDNACAFLAQRCCEIASAVNHMHEQHIYHFDIKPANILISGTSRIAMLTDMGSCIHSDAITTEKIRVHFTWAYAHPILTTIVSNPQSISGGGLKASGEIKINDGLARYDLFAFGKTVQEALAILENEFGERCHASYGFRFLHIIACLLLDGSNAPGKSEPRRSQIVSKDGRSFVKDVALDYPPALFEQHKIVSAKELIERLERFDRKYSWNDDAPELDPWQPDTINSVANSPTPFTKRVAQIFNHPCVRRLKSTNHLGWMREIFPGATHDRWSHSLGVFSALVGYYDSLLADPAVPTFRILVDKDDISHAFVAAILHDLGQTTFGHDLEEACPGLYLHEDFLIRLINESSFGPSPLSEILKKYWPEVHLNRLQTILRHKPRNDASQPSTNMADTFRAVDGVASDAIDGPIDADKFDYLVRDSIACGVPYGHGIDRPRFLQALTIGAAKAEKDKCRLTLAYKAKGRPAIESLLIARYQLYGSVYWHHSYRCILAMFVHAAASTFDELSSTRPKKFRGYKSAFSLSLIQEMLYYRVVCGKSWQETLKFISSSESTVMGKYLTSAPSPIANEPTLDFVWQFADDGPRQLIGRMADRNIYKRVFEMRVGEMGPGTNYAELKSELSPKQRVDRAKTLQGKLLLEVLNSMRERASGETASEHAAKKRHEELMESSIPLIVMDFPTRGITRETNIPAEIGDPARKYFTLPSKSEVSDDNVFHTVRKLQERIATFRVFAAPEFHELIIRYLTPNQIKDCIGEVIQHLPK